MFEFAVSEEDLLEVSYFKDLMAGHGFQGGLSLSPQATEWSLYSF